MRKYLPWAIVTIVVMVLSVLTYFLYRMITGVEVQRVDFDKGYFLDSDVIIKSDKGWIDELANTKNKEFSLPTTELQIKLESLEDNSTKEAFRIEIDGLDAYKFFCLNQVFTTNNIPYSYYKKEGYIRLVVVVSLQNELETILKEIKKYGIEYKLEKTFNRG